MTASRRFLHKNNRILRLRYTNINRNSIFAAIFQKRLTQK
jgi:hypothetical protein